jgi:hypothetical protein
MEHREPNLYSGEAYQNFIRDADLAYGTVSLPPVIRESFIGSVRFARLGAAHHSGLQSIHDDTWRFQTACEDAEPTQNGQVAGARYVVGLRRASSLQSSVGDRAFGQHPQRDKLIA